MAPCRRRCQIRPEALNTRCELAFVCTASCYSEALSRQSRAENLCEVHRCPAGALPDLFTATEAVRNDQCFRRGPANRRQQDALAHCLRDLKLVTFKAEGSGHSATAGIWALQYRARAAQQRFLIADFHQCFVMTMTVEENLC
jgi:hypothetical protein